MQPESAKENSVLENLVQALMHESSIRNRRNHDMTVTGLAAMSRHQTSSLPNPSKNKNDDAIDFDNLSPTKSNMRPYSSQNRSINHQKSTINDHESKKSKSLHSKRLESVDRFQSSKNTKLSSENWIPDDVRMRSFHRDLLNVKEILDDTKRLESSLNKEMKRLMVSDLERAKTEETLDATKKIPCGCCTQEFLYVNLPMKVSRKAILDIRVKWSGKLSSSTVFRSSSVRELTMALAETSLPSGRTAKKTQEEIDALNATFPRCYDKVGVCCFCAQFFQEPEEYRPSYHMITYQERKAAHFENKRREKEYWDPLKMMEKDREAAEAAGVDIGI